jgi:hypothetical protein
LKPKINVRDQIYSLAKFISHFNKNYTCHPSICLVDFVIDV